MLGSGLSVEELDRFIDALHKYNDAKDAGQKVLGRLAELRGTTTRAMYDSYALDVDD